MSIRRASWRGKRYVVLALAAVVVLAVAAGCQSRPRSLSVAAASDLEPALQEIAKAYEKHTGKPVDVIIGSSGLLARQIEQGAPVDVFLSANSEYIRDLQRAGLVDGRSIRKFARGRLALVRRTGVGAARPASVRQLDEVDFQAFAVANPAHAPYGQAAVEALDSAGLWKLVKPKVVYGESVSQAWQFIKSGNADYGLVALSLVKASGADYVPVDPKLHRPIVQTAAVISGSDHPAAAYEFVEVLTGKQGRRILKKYGFEVKNE